MVVAVNAGRWRATVVGAWRISSPLDRPMQRDVPPSRTRSSGARQEPHTGCAIIRSMADPWSRGAAFDSNRDDRGLVTAYLDSASVVAALLEDQAVAKAWTKPSALTEMRVAGLAGHLARSVLLTEAVFDAPIEDGQALTTAEYYIAGGDLSDLGSHSNLRVRESGEDTAAGGPGALALTVRDALGRLSARLPGESLAVAHTWFGRCATRRTVLEARVLEMVVHADDLAVSVGISRLELPSAAVDLTIDLLLEVARGRHSPMAVVRAFARRERDAADALRVF